MSTTGAAAPNRRRRGAALESALLEAAWDELVEAGYAKLTMESVASRASTGAAVLYRRWPNKDELVIAALERYRADHLIDLPNTGTLRGDLLAALSGMSQTRPAFLAIATAAAFSGLSSGSGLTPAQIRDRIIGDQSPARIRSIYQRAHDRGEVNLDHIPAPVLALPFDLVRHDLLMNIEPLRAARIESILDDLVLPLIAHHDHQTDRGL